MKTKPHFEFVFSSSNYYHHINVFNAIHKYVEEADNIDIRKFGCKIIVESSLSWEYVFQDESLFNLFMLKYG